MADDEGKVKPEGYVTSERGNVRTVTPPMVHVEVLSGFVSHERRALEPGERVMLPRALAMAMCNMGSARVLTAEELATPPETLEHREPEIQARDPRPRKR